MPRDAAPVFKRFWAYIVEQDDYEHELVLKRYRRLRTDSQNQYYWGVVVKIIAAHLGYDKDSCHEELLFMFDPRERTLPNGVVVVEKGTTTDMDTQRFSQYVESCRMWSHQTQNCYVPQPNEVTAEIQDQINQAYNSMFF